MKPPAAIAKGRDRVGSASCLDQRHRDHRRFRAASDRTERLERHIASLRPSPPAGEYGGGPGTDVRVIEDDLGHPVLSLRGLQPRRNWGNAVTLEDK